MATSSRRHAVASTASAGHGRDADVPVVGPREPCPCGSGKRYKICHGRGAARPGRRWCTARSRACPGEADWVALREIVPAATAPPAARARSSRPAGATTAMVATVLPLAWPALHRADGAGLGRAADRAAPPATPSRDVADALLRAVAAEPGTPVTPVDLPGRRPAAAGRARPRTRRSTVTVHEGFDFWVPTRRGRPRRRGRASPSSGPTPPSSRPPG